MVKVFFDAETTGVNYKRNSIIQLAGVIEVDDKVVDAFDYKIKPHPKAEIEQSALEVNKCTVEQIMAYPDMKTVHGQFKDKMTKYVDKYDSKDKAWLIGFNNRAFDDFFLRKFFELSGDNFIGSLFWVDTIDVLCLASQYLMNRRSQMPSFKLKRVAIELGIEIESEHLHEALYDVKLTRKIYRIVTGLELEPKDELF
jgi:DNA polymerase-3 subunit epsilon